MLDIVHMTAAYSNAVLVAILPYVSDFAKKLDLPVAQPLTTNQVIWSIASPYKDRIEGALILTNQFWFCVDYRGFTKGFRDPSNWFYDWEKADKTKDFGPDQITTNEAVAMARDALLKLGYPPALTHSDETPVLSGPYETKLGHVPYCRVEWDWPKTDIIVPMNMMQIEINLHTKKLVGLYTGFHPTNVLTSTPLKVDMVPELESDYKKRMKAKKMANAPVETNLIHMTPAYSNALLVAALPQISHFAAKLALPIAQPITTNQVRLSEPSPYCNRIFDKVTLNNDYWFLFNWRAGDGQHGGELRFSAPNNLFYAWGKETDNPSKYVGPDHMTTNEAIALAREALLKIGYPPEITHSYETPDLEGPFDYKFGHVPYCHVEWVWPKAERPDVSKFWVDINMERKTVVGMALFLNSTNQSKWPTIKLGMVPELESDYKKRMKANTMFFNSNAPPHFPQKPADKN